MLHSIRIFEFEQKCIPVCSCFTGRSLVQEFITDDYKTAVQVVLDRALQGSETENFEFPLITKSGARIEVLLNATTRRDEQGNIIGVVGIGQDVSILSRQERHICRITPYLIFCNFLPCILRSLQDWHKKRSILS